MTNSASTDDRIRHATTIAQFAIERLGNIHGTKFGEGLVGQFSAYIIEQASDVDADSLKRHATNLAAYKLTEPEAWARKKSWLSVPKGRRLLKALMGIVREADKAAEKASKRA